MRLLEDWSALLEADVIAIDGKSLRRSFADAAARSPVHLVQALAARARLVLGQVKVDGKSNEIATMPKLLEMLALKGRIVTADALHTHRATAEAVTAGGGDYVLALKGNQGRLHGDMRLYLDDPVQADKLQSCQQVDGDHGRIETRRATVCHEIAWLREDHDWPGLAAIGKIEATRKSARQTATETRYYIMSAPLSPVRFQHAMRRVRTDGSIKWGGDLVFIAETESGHWIVRFFDIDLGIIDHKTKKLHRFRAPRSGRPEAKQTINTVTHVTGL